MRFETSVSKAPRLNKYLLALLMIAGLVVTGCSRRTPWEVFYERLNEVNAKGTMTDGQAAHFVKHLVENSATPSLSLHGLTSITDAQAESLSKVEGLYLSGLTTITDEQAESLGKVKYLYLGGLSSITDEQAESLSNVESLGLSGLTSITDEQAESLSKVEDLGISPDLGPLINKYKNE